MLCNVNIGTGDVYHLAVDFALRGLIPLRFIRTYDSSRRLETSDVGFGWRHSLSQSLLVSADAVVYRDADGNDVPLGGDEASTDLALSGRGSRFQLTDAQGKTLTFEGSPEGDRNRLPITVEADQRGNTTRYFYTSAGVLTHVVDARGRILHIRTDSYGQIAQLAFEPPGGRQRRLIAEFSYDEHGDLIAVQERSGAAHRFAYTEHLLTAHTNPLGGVTYFDYDDRARCVYTYRSDGTHARALLRDDLRHTVQLQTSGGGVWLYRLNEQGNPLSIVDPLGRRKTYVYDDRGRLKFVDDDTRPVSVTIFDPDARLLTTRTGSFVTTSEYDARMRLITRTLAGGGRWEYTYDDQGNRREARDPLGRLWRFAYEEDGWLSAALDPRGLMLRRDRLSAEEIAYRDVFGVSAVLRYDDEDRVVAAIDAAGHETRFEYTAAGDLQGVSYADGAALHFQYDAMGDLTAFRTETGASTTFEYDEFGAPLALRNADGERGTLEYDGEGNIARIVNFKGEAATLQYDVLNQCVEARLFDGRTERYVYDEKSDVAEVTGTDGRPLLTLERDELGRIVRKRYADGAESSYEWGAHGELLSATNADATLSIEWTADLRVARERVNDFVVAYEYDAVGNRSRLTTSDGRDIAYEWDARNRLVRIVDSACGTYTFEYDAGNMFATWIGPAITQDFEFDSRLRMIRRTARGTVRGDLERTYEYDPEGRLIRSRDSGLGERSYRYSGIGAIRLVTAPEHREEYRYDADHNLTRTWDGAGIEYAAGGRLEAAGTMRFLHDEHGSVVSIGDRGGDIGLEYSLDGRLRAVRTADGRRTEYRYDPLGRRISKDVAGVVTRYFWDQGAHLGEVNGRGPVDYLFLPGTLLPIALATEGRQFSYVLDQAGTPTQLVAADGRIAWEEDHTAFGEPLLSSDTAISNPFRFQGHYIDKETGFHYNFARYYFPRCGRYLSQDPLGLDAGANLYRYVLNPYNWVDPFGLNNLVGGVLTIYPICGWNAAQQKDARKKMDAMNSKIGNGVQLPSKPVKRCGETAKDIYEDCQEQAKNQGKPPKRDLNETNTKCSNEQADHIIEICAGGGEKDCDNLQPLNESVNKSYGSQVASAVRANPGAMLKKVQLAPMSKCTDRGFQC